MRTNNSFSDILISVLLFKKVVVICAAAAASMWVCRIFAGCKLSLFVLSRRTPHSSGRCDAKSTCSYSRSHTLASLARSQKSIKKFFRNLNCFVLSYFGYYFFFASHESQTRLELGVKILFTFVLHSCWSISAYIVVTLWVRFFAASRLIPMEKSAEKRERERKRKKKFALNLWIWKWNNRFIMFLFKYSRLS